MLSSSPAQPVLIVEDHPFVAELTAGLIARSSPTIETVICLTAAETMTVLNGRSEEWFRIFLDLGVPGAYGLSLAREIRSRGLADRCCVVTAVEKPEYVEEIRLTGFLGYVFKSAPVREFTAALASILEGRSWFPAKTSNERSPATHLTRGQIQLLGLLHLGLSTRQIATKMQITEGTVNNYVARLMHHFKACSRLHAVAKAIELGLLDPLPSPL